MENISKKKVSSHLDENVGYLKEELGVGQNFDMIHLDVEYAGIRMAMFLVDGLVKDDILHFLMKFLAKVKKEELRKDVLKKLLSTYIPYI